VINVNVTHEEDHIVITVRDNGIGLQKAGEIQKSQLRTRKHIGLSLVRKRLDAIQGRLVVRERQDTSGVESIIYLKYTGA
jgi:signal transduction histidine kinase